MTLKMLYVLLIGLFTTLQLNAANNVETLTVHVCFVMKISEQAVNPTCNYRENVFTAAQEEKYVPLLKNGDIIALSFSVVEHRYIIRLLA